MRGLHDREVVPLTVNSSSSRLDWLLFLVLGLMWGSSYLFIKIGVEAGLPPLTLVMVRLVIGAALLYAVVRIAREPLPRTIREYAKLSVLGFFGIALPFYLITVAEASTDSALAAVLVSPVPLFVIPMSALFLRDETLTPARILGVVIGLVGVAILVGFDPASLARNDFFAELLLVASAVSYAIAAIYAKKYIVGYRPMIPALFEVVTALVMVTVAAFIFERPWEAPINFDSVLSVAWLGLFGSGFAFLIFFRLIGSWGATRTSTVAYLMPVVGIALGAIFLAEAITANRLIGTALVIGGVALVNVKREAIAGAWAGLGGRRSTSGETTEELVSEQR
jgi:drug/metabolite transporter (DMT)-like permease